MEINNWRQFFGIHFCLLRWLGCKQWGDTLLLEKPLGKLKIAARALVNASAQMLLLKRWHRRNTVVWLFYLFIF